MNQVKNPFILLPATQYTQMKQLINDLSTFIQSIVSNVDRTQIRQLLTKWNKTIINIEELNKLISVQFQDGKINKKTLDAQIQSLQDKLKQLKQTINVKDRETVKYSSQLMKISQENERLKQYIRKIKEQSKSYKINMENMVQTLSGKVKKYKQQYEQKSSAYEAKIRYLEERTKKIDNIQDDLDKQLEELAKLQAEGQV